MNLTHRAEAGEGRAGLSRIPPRERTSQPESRVVRGIRPRSLILALLLVAAALNGMLSYGIDRTLIDMPAWQHVGPVAWAAFSRWADLGRAGTSLYPIEGIGGALLTIAAAAIVLFRGRAFTRGEAVPIYAAAVLVIGGMLATSQAAPAITGTAAVGDPARLQRALDQFQLWGGVRAVFQALAFYANLWSLVAVARHSRQA